MILAATGHRPHKLGGFDPSNPLRRKVVDAIISKLEELRPERIISGMAMKVWPRTTGTRTGPLEQPFAQGGVLLSFRCQTCGCAAPVYSKPTKVTVATRKVQYKDRKGETFAEGEEIVKEISVCGDCVVAHQ